MATAHPCSRASDALKSVANAPLLLVVGYTSARLPRPRPLARVPRDAGFYVFSYVVLLPLSLPLILLAINWALVVFLVTLALSPSVPSAAR